MDLHWRACAHPNVVSLKDVYENVFMGHRSLLVVMEWYVSLRLERGERSKTRVLKCGVISMGGGGGGDGQSVYNVRAKHNGSGARSSRLLK